MSWPNLIFQLIFNQKYRWGKIEQYTWSLETQLEQTDVLAEFEEKKERTKVHVNLPRFKIESNHDELGDVLRALGMTEMFKECKADFSGMAEWAKSEKLHVDKVTFKLSNRSYASSLHSSKVIQKAMIEVNEEGTIAAAASAISMRGGRSIKSRPVQFIVDHPFLFFLRDLQTGMLLFQGRVVDPA